MRRLSAGSNYPAGPSSAVTPVQQVMAAAGRLLIAGILLSCPLGFVGGMQTVPTAP